MPRPVRTDSCLDCGRPPSEVGPLSRRGFCAGCGTARATAAAHQLATHRGPYFDRWRERVAASVGARAAHPGASDLAGERESA